MVHLARTGRLDYSALNVLCKHLGGVRMPHVASRTMARPTKKPKRGELARVPVLLSAEIVEALDDLAKQLAADAFSTPTRTEAIRILLVEGLRKRGLLK